MTRSVRDEVDRDERLQRRVLEAAAARPAEVPGPSPFLAARVRARVAAARHAGGATEAPLGVGALAWRVIPVIALGLAVLGVWTGVETARVDRQREDAVSALIEPVALVAQAFGDELVEPREEQP